MEDVRAAWRSFIVSCRWQHVFEGLVAKGDAQHAKSWRAFCDHIKREQLAELLSDTRVRFWSEQLEQFRRRRIYTQI